MSKTIPQLRSQRDALAKEARNNVDKDTADYDEKRQDEIFAEIEKIDAQIKAKQKQLDLEARMESEAGDADTPLTPNAGQQPGAQPGDEVRNIVFDAYLRGGERAVNALDEKVLNEYHREVRAAQSTGTDSEGGHLVPTTFAGELLTAMSDFGGVRNVADTIGTAGGEQLQWPTIDETSETGEWLAENTSANDGDFSVGTTMIGAHKASSRVVTLPIELIQDSFIKDLPSKVNILLAARLSRLTNTAYTLGDGNGKPSGIVGGAGLGHTTVAGMTDTFTFGDFTELEHSVDPFYRRNARWMFHDTVLKTAKKIKDADGRPIWLPGVTGAAPAEIGGYGYTINQDMAAPAPGADSVLFGDMNKYLIRDIMNVTLYRFTDSAYAKKGQVGFMALMRTDGKTIHANNAAIKKMRQAAA